MRWNNLKSQTIHPNQKLLFQAPHLLINCTNNNTNDSRFKNNPIIHTKKHDSLWSSNKYGVSVDKIKQDNSLKIIASNRTKNKNSKITLIKLLMKSLIFYFCF